MSSSSLRNSSMMLPLIAGGSYAVCSLMTTLSNKLVLRDFEHPVLVLFFQSFFSTLVILSLHVMGVKGCHIDTFSLRFALRWLPSNVLFVLMLLTSQFSLRFLSVPMVTIFKNVTTISICLGDIVLFGAYVTPLMYASLGVMLMSSVVAGVNDLEYDPWGYCWTASNIAFQTCYVLYLNSAIAQQKTSTGTKVFYNNCLALPTLLPLVFITYPHDRLTEVMSMPIVRDALFRSVLLVNGITGMSISYASLWALDVCGPTTYSYVGSLNKIPLSIIGAIVFDAKINFFGALSIAIGLVSSLLFAYAKSNNVPKKLLPS